MNFYYFMPFILLFASNVLGSSIPEDKIVHLKFSKINQNTLSFDKGQMNIGVNQSASPIFLKVSKKLSSIQVKGSVEIHTKIPKDPNWQDQYFSLGIIYEGTYQPGYFAKMFLPEWVLKLHEMKNENTKGIGSIDFWGVFQGGKIKDEKKSVSAIQITKKFGTTLKKDNSFQLDIKPSDSPVLALWFHADGDETGAKFKTTIHSLHLK